MVMGHTDLAMTLVRMVTHLSINLACDCLTSVVNHETLIPSYHGFSMHITKGVAGLIDNSYISKNLTIF